MSEKVHIAMMYFAKKKKKMPILPNKLYNAFKGIGYQSCKEARIDWSFWNSMISLKRYMNKSVLSFGSDIAVAKDTRAGESP